METKSIVDQLSVCDDRMMCILSKLSVRMSTVDEYPFESLMIVLAEECATAEEVATAAIVLYKSLVTIDALVKRNEDNQG